LSIYYRLSGQFMMKRRKCVRQAQISRTVIGESEKDSPPSDALPDYFN